MTLSKKYWKYINDWIFWFGISLSMTPIIYIITKMIVGLECQK